jgi:hypothetical protein
MRFWRSRKSAPQQPLSIELPPPSVGPPCTCCGAVTTRLTRFVHRYGNAYAVYYVAFSDNHSDRIASAIVSLGERGERSTPQDRDAFALYLWSDAEQNNVQVIDAGDSLWADSELLGRMLSRSEALNHPRIKEVFAITDQMFVHDTDLLAYLHETSEPPPN